MKEEKRKLLIDKMIEKRMSYGQVGKLLGISKQRVHQVYRGYVPPKKLIIRYCKVCKDSIVTKVKICDACKSARNPVRKIPKISFGSPKYVYESKGLSHLKGRDFLKKQVRRRDSQTCQICLKLWKKGERKFDVHHLDEDKEGKSGLTYENCKDLDRQVTLCHKCHLNLDSVRSKMAKAKSA